MVSGCQRLAALGPARRSASALMLAKEARTAASQALATWPPHHCPAIPQSVPSSPEDAKTLTPWRRVSVDSPRNIGHGPANQPEADRVRPVESDRLERGGGEPAAMNGGVMLGEHHAFAALDNPKFGCQGPRCPAQIRSRDHVEHRAGRSG